MMNKQPGIKKIPYKNFYILIIGILYLSIILTDVVSWMPRLILISGITLVITYIFVTIKQKFIINREILLFGLFIFWATISGFFVAKNQSIFRDSIITLYQILVLMLAISSFIRRIGEIKFLFVIVVFGALILDAYVFISGGFQIVNQMKSTIRESSLLSNPNWFAVYNLIGLFALLFLNPNLRTPFSKFIGVTLGLLFIVGILYSASQKAYLSMLLLVFAWYWFCLRKNTKQKNKIGNAILLVIFLAVLSYFTINSTFLGQRLENSAAGQDASLQSRIVLYQEGWRTFLAHPLTGVGINNSMYYSSIHQVTHSDLLEVLVTTGIIGFICYVLIYITLWNRARLILKLSKNRITSYQMGLIKSFIVTITFIGLGKPNFSSIETMVVLAGLIGYSSFQLKMVKIENKVTSDEKIKFKRSIEENAFSKL